MKNGKKVLSTQELLWRGLILPFASAPSPTQTSRLWGRRVGDRIWG